MSKFEESEQTYLVPEDIGGLSSCSRCCTVWLQAQTNLTPLSDTGYFSFSRVG